jgi:maltose alpha-D-glucosyltransferase/alpha-amylase
MAGTTQGSPQADRDWASPITNHQSPIPNPQWYQDAVFYEVPVKAFLDSNHDGVGDFPGLTSRLDYLAELGVSCVWLLPFFPSPLRDDGYDVADYRGVHPAYGGMDDFRDFVRAAHDRGLRVAAEMVVNHTSTDHPWFQAARAAPAGSPLRDFYLWSDTPRRFLQAGGPPHWSWDQIAGAYYWHRFFDHQPDLNYGNPVVLEEMSRVLRFWLDLGVDGLCLNGASYLVERDGTSGEDLPETHAILRDFRRQMDQAYPDRMIQAGLNQWPGSAAAYFGDGDECRMAPHLPLAQRLFLALRQEDRHPLSDILRQTPVPPPGCQWVTLLRNHDELTLTLATDEERDYMYREYAAGLGPRHGRPQGILRRLAPLADNSRERIVLLFGLLFSLPGAPVIYYGDEIGMGDNAYLPSRDGVRTPMQWSADRNAGFSSADFARLYCPPVMDPVYGYQAVNVEAQRRDPSSLLHSIRRLIALRRRHPALSRGSLELLSPANRKVFACLRRLGEETLLVVANLARSAQPVELDLPGCANLIPVELAGRTPFPPIREGPYTLTLGPHGLYWFLLEKQVEDVAAWRAPVVVEEIESLPVLEVAGGWNEVLQGAARRQLEERVLPAFLRSQRWFGGKARQIERVTLMDWGPLCADEARPAWLALFEVNYAGGGNDLYHLPLAVTPGSAGERLREAMASRILARLHGPRGQAMLHDALADDSVCSELLSAIGGGRELRLRAGTVRAFATCAFRELRGAVDQPLGVVRGPATSSNSLVLYGRRLLMKLFRRLEVGINPDFEIGRFLTEQEHFSRIPSVAGAIEYRPADGCGPITLAILQALVRNQGDGWSHAIDELGRYFDRASGRMHGPDPVRPDDRPVTELAGADPPLGALEVIGPWLHTAAILGRRTAEMHLALAADTHDPDFAPEPLTPNDLDELAKETTHQARKALTALSDNLDRLPEAVRASAQRLLEEAPAALERLARPPDVPAGTLKTRVHGDYHLGQVLWVDNDFIILDFEGEPTRPVAQRRGKTSPLKDVAGMLRSLDYAAYAGLFAFTQEQPDDFARLEPWAQLWQQWTSAAFLRAYLAKSGNAAFLPRPIEASAELLNTWLLDKAFYELAYELNNRPDWVRIPLRGVLGLLR